jgi:hypothetical protein
MRHQTWPVYASKWHQSVNLKGRGELRTGDRLRPQTGFEVVSFLLTTNAKNGLYRMGWFERENRLGAQKSSGGEGFPDTGPDVSPASRRFPLPDAQARQPAGRCRGAPPDHPAPARSQRSALCRRREIETALLHRDAGRPGNHSNPRRFKPLMFPAKVDRIDGHRCFLICLYPDQGSGASPADRSLRRTPT